VAAASGEEAADREADAAADEGDLDPEWDWAAFARKYALIFPLT